VRDSIADDNADPLAELFLYTADHAAHITDTVIPALDRGDLVVSDRYSDSRYAYQGATLSGRFEHPVGFVQEIHEPWTRPPDVTFYFDIDPETGAKRSGATNKFETAAYLEQVSDNYERLIEAERERFVRIDASQSREAVKATVLDAVETLL
jgi:dTMP kinase